MNPGYIESRIRELRKSYKEEPSKTRAAFYFAEIFKYEQEVSANYDQEGGIWEPLLPKLIDERNYYLREINK